MIVYKEYSKILKDKLLKLISDFKQMAKYKVNIQKINISENIKYLEINLTKNVQDYYEESYRALWNLKWLR